MGGGEDWGRRRSGMFRCGNGCGVRIFKMSKSGRRNNYFLRDFLE